MKKTTITQLFFTICFASIITTANAQHASFSEEFANLVSKDSRPGWIKINQENNLNATDFLNTLNTGLGFTKDFDFSLEAKNKDDGGAIHHVYQLRYKGIPVENHIWLLHEQRGRVFLAQGHEMPTMADVSVVPSIGEDAAINGILTKTDTILYKRYAWQVEELERSIKSVRGDALATHFPQAKLVWVSDKLGTNYTLAYSFEIYSVEPLSRKRYYVDVHQQSIIDEIELITTNCFSEDEDHRGHNHTTHKKTTTPTKTVADSPAMGKANYVAANNGIVNFTADYNGTDYTLLANNLGPDNNQVVHTMSANNEYNFDNLSEIRDADNNWLDDPTAIGAHWGTEKVYDYFLTKHNRKSFDNQGAPLLSYINYGSNYVNAFWNGVNMTYGDGDGVSWGALTSLDVIAHEIAHGVTENNGLGGLIYYAESGALNESFSDIFGVVFEFEYDPDGGDWLMGEDFDFANNNGFRSISNPHDEGDPKTYYGQNYYTGFGDNAGVHTNSGVQNFWFYLLVNGGIGTNEYDHTYNITGIGMDKAAAIVYRNLTTYMYSNAKYIDARDGAVQSAIDLYGENSAEHLATEAAWCAVGIGTTCLPSITVEKPIVNQFVINGTNTEITWTSTMSELIPFVKIEYTNQVGDNANWTLIAENEANDGSYDWFVPNIHGTTMRIRVSDDGNGGSRPLGNPLISDDSRTFNILPCAGTSTFLSPSEISLNVAATFTGDVPGDSFEWLINGVSQATTKDFTHTFTDYGTYMLTYRVENATFNCFNIEDLEIFILPDNVCEARPIDLNTAYSGFLNGSTREPDEPAPPSGGCSSPGYWCNNSFNNSVWYSFVAPASGLVDIRTEGVSYANTKIALYDGIDCGLSNSFENANLIDANDNHPTQCCDGSLISRVCLTPGVTYHVQVANSNANTGAFNINVEEIVVESPFLKEEFANCNFPDNWRWTEGLGHNAGNYYTSNMETCFECAPGVRGYGITATSYFELPLLSFNSTSPSYLFFDYAHVPKNDTVQNKLSVEVADGCGNFTTLFVQPDNELSTSATMETSNDEPYSTNCKEVKTVQVDLSSLAGMEKARIRIAAEGKWLNLLLLDKFYIGEVNDTCRMLDSLVLVDIYNATQGASWTTPWDLNQPIDTYEGVTVNRFGCVTAIDLDGSTNCLTCTDDGNNLTGNIPASIGNLLQLEYLSLALNNQLTGSIPASIGSLTKLKQLYFRSANLTGDLPTEIGNLENLVNLNLSHNQLSGPIPSSLNSLTKLNYLYLQYNQFTGLPDLSALTKLYGLEISGNPFNTNLPSWIGNLTELNFLYASSNQWIGAIPASFQNLTKLYSLSLGNNQLSGTLPDLSTLSNLSYLYLYNNQLDGMLPSWLGDLSNLYNLNIRSNNFTGVVPSFSGNSRLHDLEIDYNRFTFASILPNIVANESVIAGNSNYDWQSYDYDPQQKIGVATSFQLVEGNDYTFDLGVDEAIIDNVYKWYKEGTLLQEITGINKLTITNATSTDLGVYTCEVANPGAPDLTLFSTNYSLVESIPANDKVCDAITMSLDQTYNGTLIGAASEVNEPNAPGGDCTNNWCESELNGSVWYSFTPVTDTFVSIETGNANTKIALYEGIDCALSDPFSNASLIAANDYKPNFCCSTSFIKLACLTAGTTYYIQVEQNYAGQGSFNIILNSLTTCGLVCDITIQNSNVYEATCPGENDGRININATSDAGHTLSYELYDGQDNLLRSSNYGDFYNLSPDEYTVIVKSKDDASCSQSVDLSLEDKVDTTPPIAICPTDTIDVAFVHGMDGTPYNSSRYVEEMNEVFGDKWHEMHYETVNVSLLFSHYYHVIYLEGSTEDGVLLENFLSSNKQTIEDWVAAGNSLYVNGGLNGDGNITVGFNGVTLTRSYIDSAFIMNNHPIGIGPRTPVKDTLRGYSFAHSAVNLNGATMSTILASEDDEIILAEADWGEGKLLIGGITPTDWRELYTESRNLKLNILEYLKSKATPAANPAYQLTLDNSMIATLAVNQINVGSTDDCNLNTTALNQTTFNCEDIGIKDVILTAMDAFNNSAVCSVKVEVMDFYNHCGADLCGGVRVLNMNDMPQDTYHGGSISSYGKIYKDTVVNFVAANTIILKPGFHAAKNSTFTASIGACVDNINETPNIESVVRTASENSSFLSNQLVIRPNPFKQATLVDFQLATAQEVELAVYSMEGQQIAILQQGIMEAGNYTKEFYANGLEGGMYLIVLRTETTFLNKKVILLE